ncbi:MAG: NHL repeat-containing protein, partial [Chloroflexota bacterium]
SIVLSQLEEMSQRLYGDMRLKIYYDNEASWPYTWYLRDFPSRVYFGENPTPDIRNADAILVGDVNYSKVDPFLNNEFDYVEFTFLWWPMEDYRQISWDTIIGDPNTDPVVRRSLANPEMRQGLWDIFFYRDYSSFGAVTGKNFEIGNWPLKRNMRLYIRRDAKATLWDRGIGATLITPPVDPYAEGELPFEPSAVIGQGELVRPRNVAVGADGQIFVADSGNHRIAVFSPDGSFDFAFGGEGIENGRFNDPWGLTLDDEFLYVADTWNNRVQKFTFDGEFVASFGQSGSPESARDGGGLFYGPRDIALIEDDRLMITDTGNHRVQIFDTEGTFIQGYGGQGVLPGEFFEPVGLGVGPNGSVIVADTWNGRLQELVSANDDLFAIAEFDVNAWDSSQSIENKPYVAVDNNGRIFITDPEGYRVVYFTETGEYLGRFGTYSVDMNGFTLPNGIDVDGENNIYVVDSAKGVVFRFNAP